MVNKMGTRWNPSLHGRMAFNGLNFTLRLLEFFLESPTFFDVHLCKFKPNFRPSIVFNDLRSSALSPSESAAIIREIRDAEQQP